MLRCVKANDTMKNVHLLITDLFLPADFSKEVCHGLHLPAMEKILARGQGRKASSEALESILCRLFNSQETVADVSAGFDGLQESGWMRADPVHVRLQREQVVLLPVTVSLEESRALCHSLNEHFKDQGVEFLSPHPARWYLRVAESEEVETLPLSQALGRNIHGHLPKGRDAKRWHQLFNEIQMLLFCHPLNQSREERGELPVNSIWFWGNGVAEQSEPRVHARASSDEVLVQMLSARAAIPFTPWLPAWDGEGGLLVWTALRSALQRGDLAGWRSALQDFESAYAQPLWQALSRGKIRLKIDVSGSDSLFHLNLQRLDAWSFWRKSAKLADYTSD